MDIVETNSHQHNSIPDQTSDRALHKQAIDQGESYFEAISCDSCVDPQANCKSFSQDFFFFGSGKFEFF